MKNLLALTAFVVLTVAALGWYRGWYHVQESGVSEDGHQSINIDVNRHKIIHDVHTGEKKLHQAIENHTATANQHAEPTSQDPVFSER
ncbi:MAG TPA: hypothetical protein VFA18_01210 [Gemmataceae bacterium]|nr:hypothetical protein [Gemmataceae bacterium]